MKGEFEFIDSIRRMFPVPEGIGGIGDDCAIIPQEDGFETLVSTDLLVEGSHFILGDITPYQLGWKSAAVNFSDIAAMGGTPVGSFLAIALPRSVDDAWRDGFLKGYKDISGRCGIPLLGGDTTSSPDRLSICVTVLGKAAAGTARKRSDARIGDLVCVTGTLGDSAAGLSVILGRCSRDETAEQLVSRHYLPFPRLEEGAALARTPGVHAMMDISDGIGSDIRHILDESGVGAEIDTGRIPISRELRSFCAARGLDPLDFAIDGGEDYELLFTMEAGTRIDVPHTVIGRICGGTALIWNGSAKDHKGFRHF